MELFNHALLLYATHFFPISAILLYIVTVDVTVVVVDQDEGEEDEDEEGGAHDTITSLAGAKMMQKYQRQIRGHGLMRRGSQVIFEFSFEIIAKCSGN